MLPDPNQLPPDYTGPRPLFDGPTNQRPSLWPWWAILIIVCSMIFFFQLLVKVTAPYLPDPATDSDMVITLFGRQAIGAREFTGGNSDQQMLDQIQSLALTYTDRLRVVPLTAELKSPEEALAQLDLLETELDTNLQPYPTGSIPTHPAPGSTIVYVENPEAIQGYRNDIATLRTIYTEGNADSLTTDQRDALSNRHDWAGDLALTFGAPDTDPERQKVLGQAKRTAITLITAATIMIAAVLIGIILCIIAITMLAGGKAVPAFPASMSPMRDAPDKPAAALFEAFVLFLVSFIIITIIAETVTALTGYNLTPLLMWAPLLVAFWPMARGLTWPQLRASVGWHTSGNGFTGIITEIFCGISGYLAGIPILAGGFLITLILMMFTGSDTSHPIAQDAIASNTTQILIIYLLAVVWAPIVEETFFRGCFYAHLRRSRGIILSALITGFFFAAIHPQGFAGIPVLTAMGINFALIREWRGSIIAPMTAHALNNGFMITVLVLAMS